MQYLNGTTRLKLTLSVDDLQIIKWYINVVFVVYPDFKSHIGAMMIFRGDSWGAVQTIWRKQKLNTKSSTEAELVGVDDKHKLQKCQLIQDKKKITAGWRENRGWIATYTRFYMLDE